MRTIMALGTTVLFTLAIIVGWMARTAPSTVQAKTVVTAPVTPMDPFELMRKSTGLAHQYYDAY